MHTSARVTWYDTVVRGASISDHRGHAAVRYGGRIIGLECDVHKAHDPQVWACGYGIDAWVSGTSSVIALNLESIILLKHQ